MKHPISFHKDPISWMISHPVAANLLMIIIIVSGILMISHLRQEIYPDFEHDEVRVNVSYPSANPEEIENAILLPIEESLSSVNGIKKFTSYAKEGSGNVTILSKKGYDLQVLLNDIQNVINGIRTFPSDIERPKVTIRSYEKQTMSLVLYGETDRLTLYNFATKFKHSLLQNSEISKVDLYGVSALQYSIEIDEEKLKKYSISLEEISKRINADSLNLPTGSIKTNNQEILLQLNQRKKTIEEFKKTPIIITKTGSIIRLGDIANIQKNFENKDYFALYNGKTALRIAIRNPQENSPISISRIVTKEIKEFNNSLPSNIKLKILTNDAKIFEERVNLLLKNSVMGLLIVIILLSLFLEIRLAFWVMIGIPISFVGAFFIFPFVDVSINMVSLFAFIIALGIVVDDAIIMGENIYSYREKGFSPVQAAIKGTKEMSVPISFAILTNIIAFIPIYFIPGTTGKIFQVIPIVVITIFLVSWVESIFILPAHIAKSKKKLSNPVLVYIYTYQQNFSNSFKLWIRTSFAPFLNFILRHRYLLILISISLLVMSISYSLSGRMGMQIFPRTPSTYAQAIIKMPFGTPADATMKIVKQILNSAYNVEKQKDIEGYIKGSYARIGREGTHEALVRIYLPSVSEREKTLSNSNFVQLWRKNTDEISGVDFIKFSAYAGGPGHGSAISLEIKHTDLNVLKKASELISNELHSYAELYDINDGFEEGKPQINFTLKPAAYSLGFDAQSISREIRAAFYGSESQRVIVENDEIKIIVKLPESYRQSIENLYNLRLFTDAGKEVALMDIINLHWGYAYTQITRVNGQRVITIEANINPRSKALEIINDLQESFLPKLKERLSGLSYSFEGDQTEIRDSLEILKTTFIIAIFAIYSILAIHFRNYLQPLIVMTSIPFGIIGALAGHLMLGYSLSIVSVFGIVALSGIVVNDALILVDFANRYKEKMNKSTYETIKEAVIQRFRPIFLTTITTFGGLIPIMFETSKQAKFLIPMAISIGFGVLFATFITLLIVPALYMIVEDIKKLLK